MSRTFKLYIAMLATFLAVDSLWLGVVARGFYRQHLGYLLAPQATLWAALAIYLLLVLGVTVFAVLPGLQAQALSLTLRRAALFGFIAYATYDLTNQATVRDWPLIVTVVDVAWGTLLSTAVGAVGYYAGTRQDLVYSRQTAMAEDTPLRK